MSAVEPQWGQPVIPDLSTLGDPDLQRIVSILQERFHMQHIYTNISDIVLSVNPYQFLPLYGQQIGMAYRHVPSALHLPPHVFMTACRAHRNIRVHGGDQAIVLCGESGAGKTEILKMLVSQFGRLSPTTLGTNTEDNVASHLTKALHVLDNFGNADTGINDNASRFSKLVETFWDGDTLVGAEITCQGLEKSRVMYAGPGERNFHVFYRLLAGFDQDMLRRHQHNQSYRILESAEGGSIFRDRKDGEFHRDNFTYLKQCLDVLGIEHKTLQSGRTTAGISIFEILSALLHLGNIHFSPDPESDKAFVANLPEVEAAAGLLGIRVEDILSLTLHGVTISRGERVQYRRDVGGASTTRNSLVRYIYQQLFDWLVETINSIIRPGSQANFTSRQLKAIGILDVPGFENMHINGLEQLHHNMNDERIRHYVSDLVFHQESNDLSLDGIGCDKVSINFQAFDAFFNKDIGILRLIDDNTSNHSNMEAGLLKSIKKSYKKNPVVQIDDSGARFAIVHYRGKVTYQLDLLIAKNLPSNTHTFTQVLAYSRNPLLQEILHPERSQNDDDVELTSTQKYASTLSDLMSRVEQRETQHVWCIRPNGTSSPDHFDPNCVARQLEAMTVVEAAAIRSRGYPVRLNHAEFLKRYKFIGLPLTDRIDSPEGACHRVIRFAKLPQNDWQVRSRKVYLSLQQQDHLDTAIERTLARVVFVQSRLRGFVVRRRYHRLRNHRKKDEEFILDFVDDVIDLGHRLYYACQCQNDHNIRERERRLTGRDEGRRRAHGNSNMSRNENYYGNVPNNENYYGNIPRNDEYYGNIPRNDEYYGNIPRRGEYHNYGTDYNNERYRESGGEVYTAYIEQETNEMTDFIQTMVQEVLHKRDIEHDTWAKVICMEYDQSVGKFYVQHREVTIDGSYRPFNGARIGIGIFQNQRRDRKTEDIRGQLRKGLLLYRDNEANIWAKRLTQYDVIIEGYSDPANHSLSADVIAEKGRLPFGKAIKVFDMNELRSRIGIDMKSSTFDMARYLHLTVLCISLRVSGDTPLDTPCWLCVVNTDAIRKLKDGTIVRDVEFLLTKMSLRTEEDREKSEKAIKAVERVHGRKSWSRINHRQSITQLDSARKARMALRDRLEPINKHMQYSWEKTDTGQPTKKQLDSLQGRVRGEGHTQEYGHGKGGHWAKVKVAVKEAKLKEEREEAVVKSNLTNY